MSDLRDQLIKLAYNNPALRADLLPLITASDEEEGKEVEAGNTDTFPCPTCGTKVLEQAGYCVKCKKKVKKASSASKEDVVELIKTHKLARSLKSIRSHGELDHALDAAGHLTPRRLMIIILDDLEKAGVIAEVPGRRPKNAGRQFIWMRGTRQKETFSQAALTKIIMRSRELLNYISDIGPVETR